MSVVAPICGFMVVLRANKCSARAHSSNTSEEMSQSPSAIPNIAETLDSLSRLKGDFDTYADPDARRDGPMPRYHLPSLVRPWPDLPPKDHDCDCNTAT